MRITVRQALDDKAASSSVKQLRTCRTAAMTLITQQPFAENDLKQRECIHHAQTEATLKAEVCDHTRSIANTLQMHAVYTACIAMRETQNKVSINVMLTAIPPIRHNA